MGKIKIRQSALEIIPLYKANIARKLTNLPSLNYNNMDRMPYLSDPTIVPRVQKYLESNVDKTYVDINVMADDLQNSYREYAKRKRSAFRASVKKAYSIVLQSYGLEDQDGSSSEDDNSSSLNNQLNDMYAAGGGARPAAPPKQINDNELIDISSDESEELLADYGFDKDVAPPPLLPPSNGPSTSLKQRKASPPPPAPVFGYNVASRKSVDKKGGTAAPPVNNDRGKKRKCGDSISLPSFQNAVKKKKSLATLQEPSVTFKDVGGMDKILEDVCKLLIHVRHPEVYRQIGVSPPRGFLLHGPPGCGKTLLANAIAGEIGVPLLKVAAPELVAGVSGESEERIRELFERAVFSTPCILFIDEIDAITPNRQNAQKEMERRIVAQLLSCLDDLNQNENADRVLVIGATNRPDAIDPALRRAGRFDREICLGIPNVQARLQILKVLTAKLKLSDDFDYESLAKFTPGFVGADLMSLTREAAMAAVNRSFSTIKQQLLADKLQATLAAATQDPKPTAADLIAPPPPVISLNTTTTAPAVTTISDNVIVGDDDDVVVDVGKNNTSADTSSTGDQEIIVDDDVVLPSTKSSTNTVLVSDTSNDAIVVIDDDSKQIGNDVVPVPGSNMQSSSLEVENAVAPVNGGPHVLSPTTQTNTIIDTAAAIDQDPDTVATNNVDDDQENIMPVDVIKPINIISNTSIGNSNNTVLEDLILWLHDKVPLSNEHLSSLYITMDDFANALKCVQPSAKREGFATVPDVTWNDVGSLMDIREELQMSILAPIRHSKQFKELGLTTPTGVLLCGPPGCGKTLLAKAVANEAGINFISVKGPELLNMYVGESERAVRVCFERARNSAPCVIFFDELDAICPKRSDSRESGATMRVVNQMLTEMDGVEGREGVFLLAASNRPDIIDPAVLRPGRLDKIVFVGLPTAADRADILRAITKNGTRPRLASDVDLDLIGTSVECRGYTGADLAALVREAGIIALKEYMLFGDTEQALVVSTDHFKKAVSKIRPSVPDKDQKHYEKLRRMYAAVPEQSEVEEMELS